MKNYVNYGLFWLVLLAACGRPTSPVSEEMMLDVGDNELFLEISGPSTDAPLLLFLHGGPGNVVAGVRQFQPMSGPQTSMRRDYALYSGPKKFVLLNDSHHLPFIDEPDAVARTVREFLLE